MSSFVLETEEILQNKKRILDWYHGQRKERQRRRESVRQETPVNQHHLATTPSSLSFQPANKESPLLIVTGPEGSGKCHTVIQALSETVQDRDGGYVMHGKCNFMRHSKPFAAICSAFDDLAFSVLERSQDEIQVIREAVQGSKEILEFIPSFQGVVNVRTESERPPEEPSTTHGGSNGMDSDSSKNLQKSPRFLEVFRRFIRSICHPNRPIVLVVQHLQWADMSSILALRGMATELFSDDVFFVGTFDNDYGSEPSSLFGPTNSGVLSKTLREVEKKTRLSVARVESSNLGLATVRDLFRGAIADPSFETVLETVFRQTNGNLFHCLKIRDWLLESNSKNNSSSILADLELITCKCDLPSFLVKLLQKQLSFKTQELVKVAACFGPHIDDALLRYTLSAGFSSETIEDCLQEAVTKGVFFRCRNARLNFSHCSLQHAAYDLIPSQERELFHVEIGRRLWRQLHGAELDRNIYALLSQFCLGRRLITREKERVAIATLCLHAGQKCARSSTFTTALVYLNLGMELLGERGWKSNYDLCLALYNAAAEMQLVSPNFERMNQLIDRVIEFGRCERDKVQAISTRMYALGILNRQEESIDLGLDLLRRLGESLPARPSRMRLIWEAKRLSRRMKSLSNEQLLRLPTMEDEIKLACIRILLVMSLHALMARPALYCLIGLRLVTTTLDFGLSAASSLCFVGYGMSFVSNTRNIKEGLRYGELGLTLLERFGSIEYLPRVYAAYYAVIQPCTNPIRHSIEPLRKAYHLGTETGDMEFASVCARTMATFAVGSGLPLGETLLEWESIRETLVATRTESALALLEPMMQALHHISGQSNDPLASKGDIYDFDLGMQDAIAKNQFPRLRHIRFCRTIVSYMFGDYEQANKYKPAHFYTSRLPSSRFATSRTPPYFEYLWSVFWGGMVSTAMIIKGVDKRKNKRQAIRALKEMEYRAGLSPYNFLGKEHLLRAELCSASGKMVDAEKSYLCAIALAKDTGVLLDHALAIERTAHHFLRLGNTEKAAFYFRSAVASYTEWGGHGKASALSAEIPRLLGTTTCAKNKGDLPE